MERQFEEAEENYIDINKINIIRNDAYTPSEYNEDLLREKLYKDLEEEKMLKNQALHELNQIKATLINFQIEKVRLECENKAKDNEIFKLQEEIKTLNKKEDAHKKDIEDIKGDLAENKKILEFMNNNQNSKSKFKLN